MIVILKNISANTRKQDIKNFITPVVKGGWFEKKGKILGISILSQRNLRTRMISQHGLVNIEPNDVAERVIKKLNKKLLVGKYIAVAEYKKRDPKNDPRLRNPNVDARIRDRRVCDRRDQYEILTDEGEFRARKNFHRLG